MFHPHAMLTGLPGLAMLSDAQTRSISAENPTGAPGKGARATPDRWNKARNMGRGWKVRPAIGLDPGTTTVLADIEGPGVVQHIWITCPVEGLRSVVLRMTWDDRAHPSVEVPLGDFFCNAHGLRYDVTSLPVVVAPGGGMNCYWPMPFTERARIEVHSDLEEKMWGFFYQITYALTQVPARAARFHAQWRRSVTARDAPDHVILDGVQGPGHYVGTHLAWIQRSRGWWGEGEVKFFLDGDRAHPTICGTGTEDYVGGAWGFDDRTFSAPFFGYPLHRVDRDGPPRHGLYRFHILDPIRFQSALERATIQAIGLDPDELYRGLDDDIASVAYWYQREDYGPFPDLPDRTV